MVVDAAGFTGSDQKKLLALVQAQQEDSETGAPAAAAYKSQSGGIVDVLEDMYSGATGDPENISPTTYNPHCAVA